MDGYRLLYSALLYSTPPLLASIYVERDLTDYMYTDLWNSPSEVEEAMRGLSRYRGAIGCVLAATVQEGGKV